MNGNDMQIALRITADGKVAVAEVKRVEQAVGQLSASGKGAAGGLKEAGAAMTGTAAAAADAGKAAKALSAEQRTAQKATRDLAQQEREAAKSAKALAAEQRALERAAKAAAKEAQQTAAALARQEREAARAAAVLQKQQREAAELARQSSMAARATNSLSDAMRQLVPYFSAAALVTFARQMMQAAESMRSLSRQAELLSGSADGFRQLFDAAQRAGTGIDAMASATNNFATALARQGRTYTQTIEFTRELSAAMLLYGVRGDDAAEAMRQLGQAVNSGQLNGDELVILGERAGALYAKFERAVQEILGTQDSLKTLGSQGKLSAEVVVRAWDRAIADLRPKIEQLPTTMDQATARMGNSWKALMREMDEALQASEWYKWATGQISGALDFWRDVLGGRGIGAAGASAFGGLVESNVPEALQRVTDRLAQLRGQVRELEAAIATHGERGLIGRLMGKSLPELESELARVRGELTQQQRVRDGLLAQTVREREAARGAAAAERDRVAAGREQAETMERLNAAGQEYVARAAQVLRLNQAQAQTLAEILPVVDEVAQRYGVAREVILALIKEESNFNRMARSHAGAFGLMQLMPATGREVAASLGLASNAAQNWAQNIEIGTAYLRQQIREFGSLEKALAAYNAGPGRVRRAGGVPNIAETQDYVVKVAENLRKLAPLAGANADALFALADGQGAAAEGARKLADALLDAAGAMAAGEADVEAYLRGLREQGELSRMTAADQAAARAQIELTNRARAVEARAVEAARRGNTTLSDALLAVSRRYKEAIPEAAALARANEGAAKATDALGREAQTTAELVLGAAKTAADSIQRNLGDAFYNLFTGGLRSAKDFVAGLKDVLLRGIAEIAAQMLTQPIVVPIIGAVIGTGATGAVAGASSALGGAAGAGGSGGFGLSGLGALVTGSGLGLSAGRALAGTAGRLGLSGNWIGSSVANLATTPNWAFGVGGIGGSQLGGALFRGQYAGTGSSLGSMGGSLLGGALLGGPIGAIAGGLLGGLGGGFLGSLFGGNDAEKAKRQAYAQQVREQNAAITAALAEQSGRDESNYWGARQAINAVLAPYGRYSTDVPRGVSNEYGSFADPANISRLRTDFFHQLVAAAESQGGGWAVGRMADYSGASLEQLIEAGPQLLAWFGEVTNAVKVLTDTGHRLGPSAQEAAAHLLELSGGLDALLAAETRYRAAFWTDAERTAYETDQVRRAMAALGLAMPDSREGFRRLVEAQNLATAEGRRVYVGLLGIAGAFDALQDATAASATELARLRDIMMGWVDRMRATNPLSGRQSMADAQAAYAVQLSAARAGDQDALAGITGYAERLIAAALASAADRLEAARIRGRVLGEISALAGFADGGIATGPAGGYPVMLHGPEAIIPLRGGAVPVNISFAELLTELTALRAEVRAGNVAIGSHTARMARMLEDFEDDGLPVREVPA